MPTQRVSHVSGRIAIPRIAQSGVKLLRYSRLLRSRDVAKCRYGPGRPRMGYYVRAFCTSPDVPPLRNVFAWVRANGYEVSLDEEYESVDLDSPNWTDAAIHYKEGKSPILI